METKVVSFRIDEYIYAHLSRELKKILKEWLPKLFDIENYDDAKRVEITFDCKRTVSIRSDDELESILNKLVKRYRKGRCTMLRYAILLYHVRNEKVYLKIPLPRGVELKDVVAGKRAAVKAYLLFDKIKEKVEGFLDNGKWREEEVKICLYKGDYGIVRKRAEIHGVNVKEYLKYYIVHYFLKRVGKDGEKLENLIKRDVYPLEMEKRDVIRIHLRIKLPKKILKRLRLVYNGKVGVRVREYLFSHYEKFLDGKRFPPKNFYEDPVEGDEMEELRVVIDKHDKGYKRLPGEIKENIEEYIRIAAFDLCSQWAFCPSKRCSSQKPVIPNVDLS